jgi:hypothetical protein
VIKEAWWKGQTLVSLKILGTARRHRCQEAGDRVYEGSLACLISEVLGPSGLQNTVSDKWQVAAVTFPTVKKGWLLGKTLAFGSRVFTSTHLSGDSNAFSFEKFPEQNRAMHQVQLQGKLLCCLAHDSASLLFLEEATENKGVG